MSKPLRLSLRELRAWTGRTQLEAAAANQMTQSELSRLERRDDFLLSTLRRYAASLGGTLEVKVMLGSSQIELTDGESAPPPWDPPSVREALRSLAAIQEWLPAALAGLGLSQLRERREGCGAFSLLEQVWHLHDIDRLGYLDRVRRALVEKHPVLADVDGDRLAVERAYQKLPLRPGLDELLRARRRTLSRLAKVKDRDLRRPATLEGVGPVTLGELILRWRTHDLGHRVEVERLAAAVRGL
jgi:hypothetical protein